MNYYIKTYGCQMNIADSERIASYYEARGHNPAKSYKDADVIIINTCMVRQKAEDRIYGIVKNLAALKPRPKIIITGCLVGTLKREPSGQVKRYLKKRLPSVDEFLSMDEVGFENLPAREDDTHAWIPISNGCNNMCSYCIVPFARGREVSRPFEEIVNEVEDLVEKGYTEITLLGQSVNSYGIDLIGHPDFPRLLERIAQMKGLQKITFISSNPWDFSNELINVIAKEPNINREIHLPVQSGDNEILKKMNRCYTRKEYVDLIKRIKTKVPRVKFTTDIIVGFPGETEEQFQKTVDLCKQVGFSIAYIACYSPRPGTAAGKMEDNISWAEKKRRFHVLDGLINKK